MSKLGSKGAANPHWKLFAGFSRVLGQLWWSLFSGGWERQQSIQHFALWKPSGCRLVQNQSTDMGAENQQDGVQSIVANRKGEVGIT